MDSVKFRKVAVVYTVIVLLLLGLFASLALVRRSQDIRQRAAGQTVLRLDPVSQTIEQSAEFVVDVVMDTGENRVTNANISLKYDVAYLVPISFTAGDFLPVVVQEGIVQNGVANIVLASLSELEPVQGSGVVGQLKFVARNPVSSTTIGYDENTTITAIDEAENVFSSGETATITINRTINPSTSLFFDPTTVTVDPDQEFEIAVKMTTGDNQVTGLNLIVNYPESLLQGLKFSRTDDWPNPFYEEVIRDSQGNVTEDITWKLFNGGVFSAKLGSSSGKAVNGTSTVGTLKFKALGNGQSLTLLFNSQSTVTAQGTEEDMLSDRSSQSIVTINSPPVGGNPAPPPPTDNQNNNGGGYVCNATQPISPTNVYATVISKNIVELSWDASEHATHYGIVYGLNPGNYIYGASNVGNTTSYQVRGLAANTNYYFAVTAVNDCKSSGFSVETTAKTVLQTSGFNDFIDDSDYYVDPEPDPLFEPLPPPVDDADLEEFDPPSPPPTVRMASPTPRPSPAPAGGFGLFSPLGGILLIIAALFLGIFFFRMRSS